LQSLENAAWVNIEHKPYTMAEITDEYLLNILAFLCRGGGYKYFVTPEKIKALFKEAKTRGLKHDSKQTNALEALKQR